MEENQLQTRLIVNALLALKVESIEPELTAFLEKNKLVQQNELNELKYNYKLSKIDELKNDHKILIELKRIIKGSQISFEAKNNILNILLQLQQGDDVITVLLNFVENEKFDKSERCSVAAILSKVKSDNILSLFRKIICNNASPFYVRRGIAEILAATQSTELVLWLNDYLRKITNIYDLRIIEDLIISVKDQSIDSALSQLLKNFQNPLDLRAYVAVILAERKNIEFMQEFSKLIKNRNIEEWIRRELATALAKIQLKDSIEIAIEFLTDESIDTSVRHDIVQAFEESNVVESVPYLIEILKDKKFNRNIRLDIAHSLGSICSYNHIDELIDIFNDHEIDVWIRSLIGFSLGKMSAKRAVPYLREYFRDDWINLDNRKRVAIALGWLQDKEIIPDLVKIIENPFVDVEERVRMIWALCQIRQEEKIIPILQKIVADDTYDKSIIRTVSDYLFKFAKRKQIPLNFFNGVIANFFSSIIKQEVSYTVFHGNTDNKVYFELKLQRKNEYLRGSIFYPDKQISNEIKGRFYKDNKRFSLKEYEMDGKQIGQFNGRLGIDKEKAKSLIQGKFKELQSKAETSFRAYYQNIFFTEDLDFEKNFIKEDSSDFRFNINIEYPQLTNFENHYIQDFNDLIKTRIINISSEFKEYSTSFTEEELNDLPFLITNSLDIRYEILHASNNLVSIKFYNETYTGGAHSNTDIFVINYSLKHKREINLPDIFSFGNYLERISDACRYILLNRKSDYEPDENWINNGTSPLPENYNIWNINRTGLVFTFLPYQVGPYAQGIETVTVPYSFLKNFLSGVVAILIYD